MYLGTKKQNDGAKLYVERILAFSSRKVISRPECGRIPAVKHRQIKGQMMEKDRKWMRGLVTGGVPRISIRAFHVKPSQANLPYRLVETSSKQL